MLRHRDSSNSQEEVANDDCNKFTTNLDSLKKLHNSIDNYNKNNQASNLTSLKKEIIDVGKKIKEGESSLEVSGAKGGGGAEEDEQRATPKLTLFPLNSFGTFFARRRSFSL